MLQSFHRIPPAIPCSIALSHNHGAQTSIIVFRRTECLLEELYTPLVLIRAEYLRAPSFHQNIERLPEYIRIYPMELCSRQKKGGGKKETDQPNSILTIFRALPHPNKPCETVRSPSEISYSVNTDPFWPVLSIHS